MEMAVVKERKLEEKRKFLIEPLNMLPLSMKKRKFKVGVYAYVILLLGVARIAVAVLTCSPLLLRLDNCRILTIIHVLNDAVLSRRCVYIQLVQN